MLTDQEVRSSYVGYQNLLRETPGQHYLGYPEPDYGLEFDEWLAAHDAEIALSEYDKGYGYGYETAWGVATGC